MFPQLVCEVLAAPVKRIGFIVVDEEPGELDLSNESIIPTDVSIEFDWGMGTRLPLGFLNQFCQRVTQLGHLTRIWFVL